MRSPSPPPRCTIQILFGLSASLILGFTWARECVSSLPVRVARQVEGDRDGEKATRWEVQNANLMPSTLRLFVRACVCVCVCVCVYVCVHVFWKSTERLADLAEAHIPHLRCFKLQPVNRNLARSHLKGIQFLADIGNNASDFAHVHVGCRWRSGAAVVC